MTIRDQLFCECAGCGKILDYDAELFSQGETGEPFCDECKALGMDEAVVDNE